MKHRLTFLATGLLLGTVLTPASRGSETASMTPRRGGVLHLAQPSEIRSLDPAIAFDSFSIPIVHLMFRGLLDYDDTTGLVLDQAKDWNISSDGKTYTFHLRPGVRFANDREVEAEDYIFAFERILNPQTGSPGETYFLGILGAREFVDGKAPHVIGLRAPDQTTLVIELKEPQFTFRYVLAMTFACPVPREVVRPYGTDFASHLVGSGPYRLAEWRRGISCRLQRNTYYRGPDGFVDGVEIMIGCDDTVMTMMLERGELDQVPLASPAQAARFKRDPGLRSWLTLVDAAETDYFFMNTEMKPFDDAQVRQAVNFAIDRERLLKLAGGFATVAHGPVPPVIPWSNPGLPRYDFNPEKARALLREAGFPSGFKTELWYSGDQPIFARLAEGVQQDLRQAGIQAELRPANFTAFDAKVTTRHQVPCGIWGWFQDYPDPSDFLDVLLNGERITENECNNTAFYNNPEVNRCLDAAAKHLDPGERTRLFRQAENLIMQDAPWAPLIHEQIPVLYHPRVHGTGPHPVWLWRYERMWLDP
ncbi:MAG: ABC transporter substrate-binding protein [Verrucomicrobiota bacterium]